MRHSLLLVLLQRTITTSSFDQASTLSHDDAEASPFGRLEVVSRTVGVSVDSGIARNHTLRLFEGDIVRDVVGLACKHLNLFYQPEGPGETGACRQLYAAVVDDLNNMPQPHVGPPQGSKHMVPPPTLCFSEGDHGKKEEEVRLLVIGDSHTQALELVRGRTGIDIDVVLVNSATAYGVASSSSRTQSQQIFSEALHSRGAGYTHLVVMLGEVDVGSPLAAEWRAAKKAEATGRESYSAADVDEMVAVAVDRLIGWLLSAAMPFFSPDRVIVLGATLPTIAVPHFRGSSFWALDAIKDEQVGWSLQRKIAALEALEVRATFCERTRRTLVLNEKLREGAHRARFVYADITNATATLANVVRSPLAEELELMKEESCVALGSEFTNSIVDFDIHASAFAIYIHLLEAMVKAFNITAGSYSWCPGSYSHAPGPYSTEDHTQRAFRSSGS